MKLSHDPNNTKWTNDTESFGHKLMTSQGWQPGDYLGAKNAAHAESYTAANASHIRVSIKDDNLGLGAKIGSGVGHGECTGLDAFTNLLGRLNGKDEDELEREQKSREDLKRAIYTERKWGSVRFVPGGFLIGDKIQHLIDTEAERIRKLAAGSSDDSSDSSSSSESQDEAPAVVEKPRKSKKRKVEVLEAEPEVVAIKVKKSKKKRKSEVTPEDAEAVTAALEEVKLSKKRAKKDRRKREVEESEDDTEIKKRKKEKKSKKDRKENKDKATSDVELVEKDLKKKKSKRDKRRTAEEDESSQTTTKESTPSTPLTVESSGRSTPMMQGRHAVRARNIAQKRLAHMDVASLNQASLLSAYL
jgi:Pin2-interacting protein X1